MTDLLMIAAVAVFIIDLSGVVQVFKGALGRWLGVTVGSIKPFDCSLCITFWTGLAYLLATHAFSIGGVALVCAAALLTKPLNSLEGFVVYALMAFIAKLNEITDKIFLPRNDKENFD